MITKKSRIKPMSLTIPLALCKLITSNIFCLKIAAYSNITPQKESTLAMLFPRYPGRSTTSTKTTSAMARIPKIKPTIQFFFFLSFTVVSLTKYTNMIMIIHDVIIFGVGCNSLPAVKSANRFGGRFGVIPKPTVKSG